MNKIQTTRFGTIDITDEHLIGFRDGMIGFNSLKKYVLIESPSMPLILWLQSVDKPEIAFPVIEPYFFRRHFRADINEADKCSLGFVEGDRLKVFSVMTIPEDAEKMTVNMKAPLVINLNRGLASQVILQDKSFEVRMPAHEAFSRALSSAPMNFSCVHENVAEQEPVETWNAVDVRSRPEAAI